jgi:hypothetical protein
VSSVVVVDRLGEVVLVVVEVEVVVELEVVVVPLEPFAPLVLVVVVTSALPPVWPLAADGVPVCTVPPFPDNSLVIEG